MTSEAQPTNIDGFYSELMTQNFGAENPPQIGQSYEVRFYFNNEELSGTLTLSDLTPNDITDSSIRFDFFSNKKINYSFSDTDGDGKPEEVTTNFSDNKYIYKNTYRDTDNNGSLDELIMNKVSNLQVDDVDMGIEYMIRYIVDLIASNFDTRSVTLKDTDPSTPGFEEITKGLIWPTIIKGTFTDDPTKSPAEIWEEISKFL